MNDIKSEEPEIIVRDSDRRHLTTLAADAIGSAQPASEGQSRIVHPRTSDARNALPDASKSLVMDPERGMESNREAVAVFSTAETLQNAIDELLNSGFHRAQLSLLASEAEIVAKLGHKYRRSEDLADNVSVPRAAYVSTEAIGDGQGAAIGALMYIGAGVLLGPVAAAGGTVAAIAGMALPLRLQGQGRKYTGTRTRHVRVIPHSSREDAERTR